MSARAGDRPCQLVKHHAPVPSRTQGHHRFPEFLQRRVHGRTVDQTLLWLCGTCHDNVHEYLAFLLGEARAPSPRPGRNARVEAGHALELYLAAGGRLRDDPRD